MKHLCRAQILLGLILAVSLPQIGCNGGDGGKCDGGPCVDGEDGGDAGPAACTTIADCSSHHLCLNGFCILGDICTKHEDCKEQYICNVIKEVCVPETPCESDADCSGATPHCMINPGICVECTEDGHCAGATPHCSNAGECVACTQDGHCAAGETCEDNLCVIENGCESDTDCDSGKHCDLADHHCYDCVNDSHCTGGHVCEPGTHHCVACYQDLHCTSGDRCYTGNFTCVECLDDNDCDAGKHCNLSSHMCTDTVCTSNADCANEPGGRTKCNTATGDCVQCLVHTDCEYATQWCRDFSCQSGCNNDAECAAKPPPDHPTWVRCETTDGDCVECLNESHCTTAEKPACKTTTSPSTPPQYTCVECTENSHCDDLFNCNITNFTCRPMPCYDYPNPEETCQQIDACYYCDWLGDGVCEPMYNCPIGDECCPGYECNAFAHCDIDLNCDQSDPVCAIGYECNFNTKQCQWVSCCQPSCDSGEFCNDDTCECESGCHKQGEMCDPFSQNCCTGLRCSFFGICVTT